MLRMCWWIIASIHPAWRYPQLYTQRIVLSTTVGKKPDAIHNYPPCMLYTVFGGKGYLWQRTCNYFAHWTGDGRVQIYCNYTKTIIIRSKIQKMIRIRKRRISKTIRLRRMLKNMKLRHIRRWRTRRTIKRRRKQHNSYMKKQSHNNNNNNKNKHKNKTCIIRIN